MNIKIKSSGVACLIGDDYDRVYTVLKKQFGEGATDLFTERKPGHEYLQWVLPGEGWTALSEGDPIMSGEVRRELVRREKLVADKFGSNTAMAQRVLTVPDDDYVFYKADGNGLIDIKLTAWGYRYPERVLGSEARATVEQPVKTVNVALKFVYDGQAMPEKTFRLNDFSRKADADGMFHIGELPVGYTFDVSVDKLPTRHFEIEDGSDTLVIDCTVFTRVEIDVHLNGTAFAGQNVGISYGKHETQLTTDATGHISAALPLGRNGEQCRVSIESEFQSKPLTEGSNIFTFNLTAKEPEPEPMPEEPIQTPEAPEPESEPVPEEPQTEPKPEEPSPEPEPQPTEPEPIPEPEEPKPQPMEEEPKQEPEEKKHSKWYYILGILMTILLVFLVALTYQFCYYLFF